MRKMLRLLAPVQRDQARKSYSHLFSALSYRHEFARRSPGVVGASRNLADELGMPQERFRTFIKDESFLTLELRRHIERSPNNNTRASRREKLVDFLRQHKVLPMTWGCRRDIRFFDADLHGGERPAPMGKCYAVFDELLQFESYAMAVLELGHPVMFPIMPLKASWGGEPKVASHLKVSDFIAPFFADFSARKESFDAYCVALSRERMVAAAADMHVANLADDEEEGEDAGCLDAKKKRKTKKSQRLNHGKLDDHLRILDWHSLHQHGRSAEAKIDYYDKFAGEDPIDRTDPDARKTVTDWFSKALRAANKYVTDYAELI